MEEREVQSVNAIMPIVVTLLGIVMEEREVQKKNAWTPKVVTLFGILDTLVKLADQVCPLNPSNTVIVPVDDVNVYVVPPSVVSNTIVILSLVVIVIGTDPKGDAKVNVNGGGGDGSWNVILL